MAKKKKKAKPLTTKKKLYNVLSGIVSVFPFLFYILIIEFIPGHWSGFAVLGGIGALGVVVPILALFHFDWRNTKPHELRTINYFIIAIIVCFLLMGIGMSTTYIPVLYNNINQSAAGFYAFGFLAILSFIIFYAFSRGVIQSNLKKQFNNTELNRLTKGMYNYWWYDAINKERDMGIVYTFNKLFTASFVFGTALHILLGWWRPVVMPSALLISFSGLMLCLLMCNANGVYAKISATTKKSKEKLPNVNSFYFILYILLICFVVIGTASEA